MKKEASKVSRDDPKGPQKDPKRTQNRIYVFEILPGVPKYGVGGVVEPPGCAPKKPPGEAMEGGEAGDAGPPLEVNGGLICFSFCLLLKKVLEKEI